jgi:hypothetical protein
LFSNNSIITLEDTTSIMIAMANNCLIFTGVIFAFRPIRLTIQLYFKVPFRMKTSYGEA